MFKEKVIAASLLYILLTAIKFTFPAAVADLRGKILPILDYDVDYRAAMTSLGEDLLSDDGVIAALSRLGISRTALVASGGDGEREADESASMPITAPTPSQTPAPSPETMHGLTHEPTPTTAPTSEPSAPSTPEPTSLQTPEPTPEPTPSQMPDIVTEFLEAQSAFAGHSIPDNVVWDLTEIPFEYSKPVSGYNSSGFGYREHPIDKETKFHYGTDYAVYSGTEISAFADGYVAAAEENASYGKYVIIAHEDGFYTLYAHCSELLVEPGQIVSRGERIALAGETGVATGPHLHFELRNEGLYMNPEYYV